MDFSENKILKIAFLISIVFHTLILIPFNFSFFLKKTENKKSPNITVTYQKTDLEKTQHKKGEDKEPVSVDKEKSVRKEKTVKKDAQENKSLNKAAGNKIIKVTKKESPEQLNKNIKELKKEIKEQKISEDDSSIVGLEQVPAEERIAFLEYYRFIRNKIEVVAQKNRPEYFKEGKVNVVFRLNSNGHLLNVKIQNNSSTDKVLRSYAIRDIKIASPFLPFPKGLTADELEFRITIEFHI